MNCKEISSKSNRIEDLVLLYNTTSKWKNWDVGMAKHFSKSMETRNELSITLYLQ